MNLAEHVVTALRHQKESQRKEYGIVTGIVVDLDDPRQLGRVRVNFPDLADMETDGVAMEAGKKRANSNWARLATLMAGRERGSYFIPEINDEVIVAFEHGDLNHPIVLGAVWNNEDKPPMQMDRASKNDIRAIYSRSGHKIVLNDSSDQPSIRIGDKDDKNSIFIDLAKTAMQIKVEGDLTIEAGGKITIKAGDTLTIEAQSDLKLTTQANLNANAGRALNLEANSAASLKGQSGVAIESSGQSSVKGATVSVNGSGMAELKGGMVKIN
jgi:uncharacterized protein involved in type VI secretion and phage assembly